MSCWIMICSCWICLRVLLEPASQVDDVDLLWRKPSYLPKLATKEYRRGEVGEREREIRCSV